MDGNLHSSPNVYCFFYRWLDASVCCMWYVVCITVVIDTEIFPIPQTNFSLGRRNKMTLTLTFDLLFVVFLSLGVRDSGTVRKIEITVVS